MASSKRYDWLDALRSFAIYLMVIFHLSYDLDLFGHVEIDFQNDPFWLWFPCLIVFLFLTSVGMSLRLAHFPDYRWPSFWRRWRKIVLSAIGISIVTYFAFPKGWIYFGTLHNIAFNSIFCLPFLGRPRLAMIIAVIIVACELLGVQWPWIELAHSSMDYIPPLPWFSWVLMGIFLQAKNIYQYLPSYPQGIIWQALIWPGKHSLKIYLGHQVVLYSLVWAYTLLTQ